MAEVEKATAVQDQEISSNHHNHDYGNDDEIHGFETDLDHLPPGYYRSPFFLGSFAAIGLSLACMY
jgi:hypothetical protein